MKRLILLLTAALALGLVAGCGSSADRQGTGTGTVHLLLTDAPAAYDHVYLDVREVWIRGVEASPDSGAALLEMRDGDRDGGWIRLDVTPVVVDLLTLTNGVFLGLGSGEVPAGRYDEFRLVLGGANTIVVDGVTHDLKVPSGMSSGLKLKGVVDVPAGGSVDVGFDFDAARSIVETGSGHYLLKPVVRVYPVDATGAIAGDIDPDAVPAQVLAIAGTDTAATTPDAAGKFTIALLRAGTYRVEVLPGTEAYADTTLEGVVVTPGQTAQLGTITLTPAPGSEATALVGR